jgi:hypothetical protein
MQVLSFLLLPSLFFYFSNNYDTNGIISNPSSPSDDDPINSPIFIISFSRSWVIMFTTIFEDYAYMICLISLNSKKVKIACGWFADEEEKIEHKFIFL